MPYILIKSDGTTLTTVQDATVDNTTSLTFVGRNYSGYGQTIEENFLHLLENFSSPVAPAHPIQGQLWFNSTLKQLQICYDGSTFINVSNATVSNVKPADSATGSLWWDTGNNLLKVYVNGAWESSSVFGGAGSSWDFNKISSLVGLQPSIKAFYNTSTFVVFSNQAAYSPLNDTIVSTTQFPIIKPGITLPGADPITGSSAASTSTGYLLWGTAAEAITTKGVTVTTTSSNNTYYIPFANNTAGNPSFYTNPNFNYNPNSNVLQVTASSALYADIAERYAADDIYEPGTVLVIGGSKEVTTTSKYADTRVAGIVSKTPAYMMNSAAGTDETHPYIALKGRVPCKVVGSILKGDLLVTSTRPGYAQRADGILSGAIIGKALEDNFEGSAVIEVLVV
jgi:hypothetical protein